MKLAAKTDIGNCRKENQDNYRAVQLPNGVAWALVCDGMGGANGGSVASQLATDFMQDYFAKGLAGIKPNEEQSFLVQMLMAASQKIYDEAQQNSEMAGMGTTAVCALVRSGVAHIVHMGDSRAYLLRGRVLVQITRDHSMVQELVESGKLTKQEAQNHPQKNLITRALGVDPKVLPEYTSTTVAPGDIIVLCTDGLSNYVPDEQMQQILSETPFFDAPDVLAGQALAAGGQDNITVLLIGIEPSEA